MSVACTGRAYEPIGRLLNRHAGFAPSAGQARIVQVAVSRIMRERHIPSVSVYHDLLSSDSDAMQELVDAVVVGETYFFRDPAQFDFIREEVVPGSLRRRPGRDGLRCWSAGSASGEEPYSLAILLEELGIGERSRVLGTDISSAALERARRACYRRWSLRGVPDRIVRTYFRQQGERFELDPRTRGRVEFRLLNLTAEPSKRDEMLDLDLILCRNVLIYLDPAAVARVARRLLSSLAEDGWLLLGAADPLLTDLAPCEAVIVPSGLAYRRARRRARAGAVSRRARIREMDAPIMPSVPLQSTPSASAALAPSPSAPLADAAAASLTTGGEIAGAGVAPVEAAAETVEEAKHRIRALLAEGVLPAAARACSAALDCHDPDAELLSLHALLLHVAGQEHEAVVAARRALYLDRSLIAAHVTLGQALSRAGDREDARRALRNALVLLERLEPDEPVPGTGGERVSEVTALVRVQLDLLFDEVV